MIIWVTNQREKSIISGIQGQQIIWTNILHKRVITPQFLDVLLWLLLRIMRLEQRNS
jgi:hypothetical protein